jgi:hypothetical protein
MYKILKLITLLVVMPAVVLIGPMWFYNVFSCSLLIYFNLLLVQAATDTVNIILETGIHNRYRNPSSITDH